MTGQTVLVTRPPDEPDPFVSRDLLDPARLAELTAQMDERRQRQREAERPHAIPGLDCYWWCEQPPVRVWTTRAGYAGALAALAPIPAVNGYVLLPERHPWRELGLQGDEPDGLDVHGGITFGPHVTGWIGFDTGHAGDEWEPGELRALHEAGLVDEQQWQAWQRWPTLPAQPWGLVWTLDRLAVEVERLAEQAAAAAR